MPDSRNTYLLRIGLQLFSIPKLLDADFEGTLAMLARLGYKEIEFFGPYDFSARSEKEHWAPIGVQLGMRGSGYYGLTAKQVRAVLDLNGMASPSMQTDLESLRTRMSELAEAAHIVGHRYVILPSLRAEHRVSLDSYKRAADMFNEIGAQAVKEGIRFAYHNHGYGFAELDGHIPIHMLLEHTDPALVDLQMDIYWTTVGGADPIELLKRYPNRYRLLHIKDMTTPVRFAGDGGDPSQWIEMFPYMADVGDGIFDLAGILSQARKSGVQHFIVERDLAPNADAMLENSYKHLVGLKLDAFEDPPSPEWPLHTSAQ
jgi:sugar phosphate isomerase/epimerase